MKRLLVIMIISLGLFWLFGCSSTPKTGTPRSPLSEVERPDVQPQETSQAVSASGDERLTWPRVVGDARGTLKMYQPQIERWSQETLEGLMAIEVTLTGEQTPLYGSVLLQARTDTNMEQRLVRLTKIQVVDVTLPALDAQQVQVITTFVNTMFRDYSPTIPLDQLVADLAGKPGSVPFQPVTVSRLTCSKPFFLSRVPAAPECWPILQATTNGRLL